MMVIFLLCAFQIIIESLPISSSGHINLLKLLLKKFGFPANVLAEEPFRNLSNAPTLIVFAFYFFKQWSMLLKVIKRNIKIFLKCAFFIISATIVTLMVCGLSALFLLGMEHIIQLVVGKLSFTVWYKIISSFGFFTTGFLLFSLRFIPAQDYQSLTYKKILCIGCAQGIAFIPGISRLGITYIVGRWLHLRPHKSFIISCALEAPLLVGGLLQTWLDDPHIITQMYRWIQDQPLYLLMIISALFIAYYILGKVEHIMRKEKLWKFAFYMIIPFILALIL